MKENSDILLNSWASNGVGFFFVLSGFLMTFLLLKENETSGTIHIKSFYMRRILRIWPLYFFIIFIAFALVPLLPELINMPEVYTGLINRLLIDYGPLMLLFIFMMPNVALCLYAPVLWASHTWSIGVEEQFYLIWPVIMKKFLPKLMKILLIFLSIKLALQLGLFLWQEETSNIIVKKLYLFCMIFKLENMIIGGLGACIIFYDLSKLKAFIFNRYTQIATIIFILIIFGIDYKNKLLHPIIVPVAFTIFLLNVSLNEKSFFKLNSKIMNRLGEISYGIYMYHPVILYIIFSIIIKTPSIFNDSTYMNVILYSGTIICTLTISFLSYRLLELPFIRHKDKYAYVKTKP